MHVRGQSSISSIRSQAEAGPSSRTLARVSGGHEVLASLTPASPSNATRQPTHVQAIHDFDPSLLASTSTSNTNLYLSFKAGEIIRVHVRDATGWWDGEISSVARSVNEGSDSTIKGLRRGWFPSNYVREMGWESSHHRAESATSASTTSPNTHHTRTGSITHSRQTSATSQHSRTSTSETATYQSLSPPHRSNASSLPPIYQTLMHPIVQSLSLLESAIHSNRKPHIQPSTACVISSIRAALMQTDCLSKESATLVKWPVLAKERKIVLVELSKLVNCARSASGTAEPLPENYDETKEMEALAKAARGVFGSVKRFLLLANDRGVEPTLIESNGDDASLPAPLSDSQHSSSVSQDRYPMARTSSGSNSRLQEAFRVRAASIGDLRAARQRAASPPPPMPSAAPMTTTNSSTGSLRSRTSSNGHAHTPLSATFAAGHGRSSPPPSARSLREHHMQSSIDSAFTVGSSEGPHSPWDASTPAPTPQSTTANRRPGSFADVHEAIGLAEDALLSIIAAFIGHIHSHHIGSHPSSHAHLIEMTRETIDSVRELLTIVEAVGRNPGNRRLRPREIESLRIAKDQLYDVASRLVESAEVVAHAPFAEYGEESYDTEKAKLLQTATGTLRAGTECVRLVKLCAPEDDDTTVHATPRQAEIGSRQSTPRPAYDTPMVLRDKPVGQRGVHTLSGLHRKATSLSNLSKRYQQDGGLVQSPLEADEDEDEDEDDEEFVQDNGREEDLTMRLAPAGPLDAPVAFPTRPSFHRVQTSPVHTPSARQPSLDLLRRPSHELLRTFSDNGSGSRSRSSSLTSPAPPRMKHRSPSRSADLDKFTNDFDFTTPPDRRASRGTISTSSRLSMYTSASSQASTAQTSVRSSNLSDLSSVALQTPLLGMDDTMSDGTVLEPATSASSSSTDGVQLRVGDLSLTEATPMKSHLSALRPSPPVRSMTAPMPTASTDVRFWLAAHDYDPREITFNAEGGVVGASLAVLVEKMTPHDGPVDPTFGATFFFTFRLFTTPSNLLDAIIERYSLRPPPVMAFGERERAVWVERKVVPIRLRIYNFLKTWLEQHWRSELDDEVLDTMEVFVKDVVCVTLPAMGPRLLDAIRRRQNEPPSATSDKSSQKRSSSLERVRASTQSGMLHPPVISGGLPPTPVVSKNLHSLLQKAASTSTNLNITEFDTIELARQFTIMESKMFAAVAPEDLLQTGKKTIPELRALSTLSNQITGWVADSILNETDAKKRANLMKFFIKLADKCLILNNFSTLFAVLAGLNSSTIMRLKKTWDALSSKYRIIIERLRGIIEHTKNHAAYRARLREAPSPCLPFLGLILTDITFTSDGNSNTRPSTLAPDLILINQDKYTKLGKIAMEFKRYQEPFNFHELEAVQTFLRRVLTERGSGSIDALYRKSCGTRADKCVAVMLEPRQGSERFSSNVERPNWLTGKI